MRNIISARGFSLLEVLIAAALLAGAVGVLAHLVIRAVDQSLRAEQHTESLVLAQGKLEQLRAVPFTYGDGGARVDHPDLAATVGDSLTADLPPYVEALDRFGGRADRDTAATFVRRWSIASSEDDPDTLRIAVCVSASRVSAGTSTSCAWTIRTRQP